jgi:ParB-like chromosome segregation protein Spo0J
MEKEGQLVTAIIYPDPERPGHYLGADANRRAMSCRILGRKLRAYVLESAPLEEEIIRIRAATNYHRKNASAYEIAADIKRWMELKGATQRQAAEAFGISAPQVSKLLDKLENACLEVRQAEESKAICPDSARIIATLRSPDQQREALKEALARNLTREAVERLVARMKGSPKKTKAKPLKLKLDGVQMVASNATLDGLQAFTEQLLAALRKLAKDGDGIEFLPARLKGT